MRNRRRRHKQHYSISITGEKDWWCDKCKKFVEYSHCNKFHHTLSSSVNIKNIKKLNKLLRVLYDNYGFEEIVVTRWISWSPVYGYLNQDFILT